MATHHINREQAVRRLGQIYLINCTCTGAAGILISFIYDRIGLYNLGQTNLFMIYIGYCIASFFPAKILGFFRELKLGLAVGFFVNGLQILAAIWTYSCYALEATHGLCSVRFLGFFNISIAFAIGLFSNVYIWTGNFEFIARVSTNVEKKVMFAIYNSYLVFNAILANFLNIVFYSYEMNSLYVFIVSYIIFLLVTSSIYWYLPDIDGYVPEDDPQEKPVCPPAPADSNEVELKRLDVGQLRERVEPLVGESGEKEKLDGGRTEPGSKAVSSRELKKTDVGFYETVQIYSNLMKESKYYALMPYLIQSGLFQGFSQGSIYRLVVDVYATNTTVNESYVKKMICVVLIGYAISSLGAAYAGQFLKGDKRNLVMKLNSSLFAILMVIQVFFARYITSIWVVAFQALLFGTIDIMFQQLIAVYLSETFPNATEPYALFKLIQNFICGIFMVVYIVSSTSTYTVLNAGSHVCLAIWFVLIFDKYNAKPLEHKH